MAETLHFTEASLRALQPSDKRQYYHDDIVPKLGVYVTPNNARSYYVKLLIEGKTTRRMIGKVGELSVSMARRKATILIGQVAADGTDPLAAKREQQAAGITLHQCLSDYFQARTLKALTVADYTRAIEASCGQWLDKPLADITESKVKARYLQQGERSKARADIGFRVLKALFNFARHNYKNLATGESYFETNPVKILGENRMRFKIPPREGVVTDGQLPLWWQEVMSWADPVPRRACMFLLFTGARRNEAATLLWEHVDLAAGTWHIPDPKNKKPITLPLCDYLTRMLTEVDSREGFVFPSKQGGHGGYVSLRDYTPKLKKALGTDYINHDLRRSFVSRAAGLNINYLVVKRLVNHSSGSDITAQYFQASMPMLREASERIEQYILQIVGT